MSENAPATYIKRLPLDVPVKLCVEKVIKKDDKDSCFVVECRVCDGDEVGKLMAIYFYRNKKDGSGARKDTTSLIETLCPGRPAHETPSYSLQGKIFQTTPWQPQGSSYPMYSRFKFLGVNDIF
jgi:hypothetical protein